jgi:hypothetical protein
MTRGGTLVYGKFSVGSAAGNRTAPVASCLLSPNAGGRGGTKGATKTVLSRRRLVREKATKHEGVDKECSTRVSAHTLQRRESVVSAGAGEFLWARQWSFWFL